jgi:hypothetical protein
MSSPQLHNGKTSILSCGIEAPSTPKNTFSPLPFQVTSPIITEVLNCRNFSESKDALVDFIDYCIKETYLLIIVGDFSSTIKVFMLIGLQSMYIIKHTQTSFIQTQ